MIARSVAMRRLLFSQPGVSASTLRSRAATTLPSSLPTFSSRRTAPAIAQVGSPRTTVSAFSTSARWRKEANGAEPEGVKVEVEKADQKAGENGKKEGEVPAEKSEVEKKLASKEEEIEKLKSDNLYLKASLQDARLDFANLQRRSKEETAKASDYAISKLATELASTVDVLTLALKAAQETGEAAARQVKESGAAGDVKSLADLYEGVRLTYDSLLATLKRHGVESYDPTGEKFDPEWHEALYQAPIPGKTPGTVLETQKLGYRIKDRVLRPAQVGVVQG